MNFITCKDLAFSYDGRVVLSNINFSIDKGSYLCILGENGAGKSTLLQGLLGLKKPSNGSLLMDRSNLKAIGYLPQQMKLQANFPATSFEIVLSGCLSKLAYKPFYTKKEKSLAKDMLDKLNASHLANKSFNELSGGQKQRILLARALCASDELLLLDEPVSGLDPIATLELYKLIKHINETMNVTVIMVSHNLDAALKYASHILHITPIASNEPHFFGTTQMYKNSNHIKEFMGGCHVK